MGDVAEVIMGQSPKSETYNQDNIGLPFYQGVKDFGDRFTKPRVYCSNPHKILNPGDILLSVRAPVGKVNITKEKCSIGRGNAGIRHKDRLQHFLFYCLKHFEHALDKSGSGSVFSSISKSDIENFEFLCPPLPEQKAIAEVLSSLDDKIDLLHRQNKTLEDMAQTLFRKWFVEDADEGWEKKRLGDIVDFKKGRKATRTENFEFEHSVPQILIETFDTGNTLYSEAEEMVIAEDRDILMVMDGASSGRTEIGFRGALGSTIGLYRPLDNFRYPFFIFCFLKTQEKYIRENTTGSAIPHADRNLVLSLKFRFSSMKKVIGFENFVGTLLTKKQSNLSQIRTLEKQRDTLLPGLMNRKVRLV